MFCLRCYGHMGWRHVVMSDVIGGVRVEQPQEQTVYALSSLLPRLPEACQEAHSLPPPMAPVRVALLGCGVFARDAYLNILKTAPDAQLVAIWSRSEATLQGALPAARE